MNDLKDRFSAVQARIAAASDGSRQVSLLAVSKQQPATAIRALAALGQREFGENYLQEAEDKQNELSELKLIWHFIGAIQSNKTRSIAERFDWVQSVDRLKIAQRLNAQRPDALMPLNICLQVNISGEASKAGFEPAQVGAAALAISDLPRLTLRGLMAIPRDTDDRDEQAQTFAGLRDLFDQLNDQGLQLDTLSMGMSHDLEAAVAAGATMLRVGQAIFGPRGDSQ